jgi:nucleoside-diphosphate-sugar epimerase
MSARSEYGWSGRRVLITGGLGFIGSNLARRLVDLGAEVTLVDSLVPQYGGNRHNIAGIERKLKVNISDVRDRYSFRALIEGQDVLFNLAGQTSHQDSMTDPFTDLDINCTSQLSILESCRQFNPDVRVVFASTRQFYGRPDYLPVDENHPLRPTDINGINKMAGEWYHVLYNNVHGIRACALRLTNTYGPGMRVVDARQTFLGIWIRLLLEGKPIQVWGGSQLRDFNHVSDVVDALLLAAASESAAGQVYNLGDSEVVSLENLAKLLVAINGSGSYEIKEFPADRKRIDIGDYYADFSRFSALGWSPKMRLAPGLEGTLDFYRQHLPQYIK